MTILHKYIFVLLLSIAALTGCGTNSDNRANETPPQTPAAPSAPAAPQPADGGNEGNGGQAGNGADSGNGGQAGNDPANGTDQSPPPQTPAPTSPPSKPPAADPVSKLMSQMTLRDKIGQMVMVGIEGTEVGKITQQMLQQYKVGGIIVYANNLTSVSQTRALLNSLKQSSKEAGILPPLLLGTDQEGGRVSRFPAGIDKFPASRVIGNTNNADYANKVGQVMGSTMKAFGLNMDFAPDLDVNTNPNNPVIGDRAFGTTPQRVIKMGISEMKGIGKAGVIPVVKHFPGHGDTSVDSHKGLPVVTHGLDRLRKVEFAPFQEAVQQGADAVMVAHLLMSQLDPNVPSSMSKVIIQKYLRKELGFEGVVITDDMTMGAIGKNYTLDGAVIRSVLAGSDIILVGHEPEKQRLVLQSLYKAAQNGKIPADHINASVRRILELKQKYKLTNNPVPKVNSAKLNTSIRQTLQ
ncbi:beta-N-acetylhexosaminidase [Paenibacillus gansuensis]|uniref:beta-N-acetylhexosaminidase n=1 Tax=Paenibacillus gansuensis TaxID=306542 RepID=A0ABW5P8A1_9BACL